MMLKKLLVITMVTSLVVLSFASCKNDAKKSPSTTKAPLSSSAVKSSTNANGTSLNTKDAKTPLQPPVSNATPTVAPTVAPLSVNLSVGKKAVASSECDEVTWPASYAIDGDMSTRWAAITSDDSAAPPSIEWCQVDLGDTYVINKVIIYWEVAYALSYQIQVSNDATTWETIYSTTEGDGADDELNDLSGSGRYIRMNCTEPGTVFGPSMFEFEVYGHK